MRSKRAKCCKNDVAHLLILFFLTSVAPAQDWLGFHGLDRQGVGYMSPHSVIWSGPIETSWKTSIPGFGFSSPVIAQDKIYLTSAYETDRGAGIRKVFSATSQVLAWVLLTIVSIIALQTASRTLPGRGQFFSGARAFLTMSAVLVVVGICSFAQGVFSLDSSVLRSWKLATGAALLSFFTGLLLVAPHRLAAVFVALAATALSGFAYRLMPRPECFFDFSTTEGLITTGVVVGPAVIGWGACLLSFLARFKGPSPQKGELKESRRARGLRVAFYCGLPALLAMAVLGGLTQRMLTTRGAWAFRAPDEPPLIVQIEPVLGWPLLAILAALSLVGIVVGSRWVLRTAASGGMLRWSGAAISVLLGLSSFLCFGALPPKRQVAYAVVCVDKKTKSIEWLREVGYSTTLHDSKSVNSHATPTVASGADGLCAYFGSGGLYGLDRTGKVRWHVRDAEFDSPFGVAHSPVVADGIVVLANDNEVHRQAQSLPSHMIAYRLSDGRELWRQQRERSQPGSAGFSTPVIRNIWGRKTILMRGWEDLTAYDLQTGKVQWSKRLKHRGNFLVAGLVTDSNRVYVLDGEGMKALDLAELAAGHDATAWMVPIPGEKMSSPILVDGLLFMATDTGKAVCLDAETGKVEWRQKLGGRFFSSVVAQGNSVIFANEAGDLSIVARSRSFEVIAQKNIGEKLYATPIPQADGLLVRGATNLYYLKPSQMVSSSGLSTGAGGERRMGH